MKLFLTSAGVLLYLSLLGSVESFELQNEYIIIPDSNHSCRTCLTLSQFAANTSYYLAENTTLVLQPGNHSLRSSLLVFNVSAFTMYQVDPHRSRVQCEQSSELLFETVNNINITSLNLLECFNSKVVNVKRFGLSNARFYGSFFVTSGTGLEIIESNAYLTNCLFTHYYYGIHRSVLTFSYTFPDFVTSNIAWKWIGGALIVGSSNVTITQSNFTENRAQLGGAIYAENSSNVSIFNTTFHFNTANSSFFAYEDVAAGGALYAAHNTSVTICSSYFNKNNVFFGQSIGGALAIYRSAVIIEESMFTSHIVAQLGGVAFIYDSTTVIQHSTFNNCKVDKFGSVLFMVNSDTLYLNNTASGNHARTSAGVIFMASSVIHIHKSNFSNNFASVDGGVIYARKDNQIFLNSGTFSENFASYGGVIKVNSSLVEIQNCMFSNNTADDGGVLYLDSKYPYFSSISIHQSSFFNNTARNLGGVLYTYSRSNNTILECNNTFIRNKARGGATVYAYNIQTLSSKNSYFEENEVMGVGIVFLMKTVTYFSGKTTFYKNTGTLLVIESKISFAGMVNFTTNAQQHITSDIYMKGGAITSVLSEITSNATLVLHNNTGFNGGALFLIDSKLFTSGDTTISNNNAHEGGGLYLYQSELLCMGQVTLLENNVNVSGGGIHAVSSFIRLSFRGSLLFMRNHATQGGGLYLTGNSKITVVYVEYTAGARYLRIRLINNSAEYGGGIFVDDESNIVTCTRSLNFTTSTSDECFLQVASFYNSGINFQFLLVRINKAAKAGANIYGGFLDRCRPTPAIYNQESALHYLKTVSNIENLTSVSSKPVRVCLCSKESQYYCASKLNVVNVTRGRDFQLQVVALDQVNNTLNATIYAYSSGSSGIGEGQYGQKTYGTCTNLTYRVFSKYSSETLTLYADGPCKDSPHSLLAVEVLFEPCQCPLGFTQSLNSPTICRCECDKFLRPYLSSCNVSSHLLLRESTAWIGTVRLNGKSTGHDKVQGYLVHTHCPFDYCKTPSIPVYINLSNANGADAQCAFNRKGVLCGACKPSFSLALGSNRCLQCSSSWVALLVPLSVMGLVLVVSLLVLNLTVSKGAIISIVFYSNLIIANRAILIPLKNYNFLVMFLSWLSLDLGIETCFVNGLDAYTKLWLQFIFPSYMFMLIFAIIVVSEYSKRFSDLIGGRNPIATLATLIWFSNAKLFRTVISAVSFTVISYSDNTRVLVWFPDGNIQYLKGKHIPLFVVSLVVLIIAIVYILIVLSWQWILCLPKCKILCWTRNTKFISLMDAYHAPFKDKHRYWPGLLLFVSMLQYFISGFTITGNPTVNLLAIIILVTTLTIFKSAVYGVYKQWPLDLLETTIQFNLILFASATMYTQSSNGNQVVLANISLSIVFATFNIVVVYHLLTLIFPSRKNKLFNLIRKNYKHSSNEYLEDYRETDSLQLFEYSNQDVRDSMQFNAEYTGTHDDLPDCKKDPVTNSTY